MGDRGKETAECVDVKSVEWRSCRDTGRKRAITVYDCQTITENEEEEYEIRL
jgi:hypothetical protein